MTLLLGDLNTDCSFFCHTLAQAVLAGMYLNLGTYLI